MGITRVGISGRLALACSGCGEMILSWGAKGTGTSRTPMAARGASRAAGAAHTLRSPTACSGLALDPFADGGFSDAKCTPQHRDVSSFEEYYAVLSARGWLLGASGEPPKGMYGTPLSPDAGSRSGECLGGSSPPRPRGCSGVGLGVLRLLRSPTDKPLSGTDNQLVTILLAWVIAAILHVAIGQPTNSREVSGVRLELHRR
jgi:hypothetical protein